MTTIDPAALNELDEYYARVSGNVKFQLMATTTLVVVGTGASGQMIEGFVRLGVKKLHLYDLDIVERKNLPAQNFTHDDIGRPKTEAKKRRLHDCEFEKGNPNLPSLEVITHGDFLLPSDEEIAELIKSEKDAGRRVIFIMASDFHPVQARGSRIALKFGVPVFWVGIYRNGMAGEIIFFESGNGLNCYRCITESRYRHWDQNHLLDHLRGTLKKGRGHSAGLPMAAMFIDAILSHLVIGAIHKEVDDNPHGALYRRLLKEKRNFIQTQLDPGYRLGDEGIFGQIQGSDVITFNTLFQQGPNESPGTFNTCLDCCYGDRWTNTDYTKDDYDECIESIEKVLTALLHGYFRHELRDVYADLLHSIKLFRDESK